MRPKLDFLYYWRKKLMKQVFISGSIQIKQIDNKVRSRIDNILDQGYGIIVGDANGVDYAVQEYLKQKDAESVVVYCSGDQPRNNVGRWETRRVLTDNKQGTVAYYTAKDIKMADDCDYGLMVWNAESTGTLSNVIRLLNRNKNSLVYMNNTQEFLTISNASNVYSLLKYMAPASFEKAEAKLNITAKLRSLTDTHW